MGRVASYKIYSDGYMLHPGNDKNGYKLVVLTRNKKHYTRKVHRLVLEAFISNPKNYPQVNHKDDNKANNCLDNLEWCSASYNNSYGSHMSNILDTMKKSGRMIPIVAYRQGTWYHFESLSECAQFIGSDTSHVSRVVQSVSLNNQSGRMSVRGYLLAYARDKDKIDINVKPHRWRTKVCACRGSEKVTFNSTKEASCYFKIDRRKLSYYIKNGKEIQGWKFSYMEDE